MNFLSPFTEPFLSQEPASILIRTTAKDEWRLISLNLGCNLLAALTEGATLGIVFLAVKVLSAGDSSAFNWASVPIVNMIPAFRDRLSDLPTTALFLSLLGVAVLLQLFQSISSYLILLSTGYFAARCKTIVTAQIHSEILRLSFPCASNYKVGDLTDYASQGPYGIRIQIEQTSLLFVGAVLCCMYLFVLIRISPLLLVAVVFIGLVMTLVQKKLLPRIRAGAEAVTSSELAINTRITEDFQGLRLLHSTGQLKPADERVRSFMAELESRLRAQARRMSVVGPLSSTLPILATAVMAALSVFLLSNSSNGVLPSLVTFVLALQKLNGRLNIINVNLNNLADNSGRMQRLNAILSTNSKQYRRLGGISFISLNSSIQLKNVSLRYSPELPPALSDVSFSINKGQFIALVGPSGAGKSSIADLLTGLYSPTSGKILIDGQPMDQLDLESWQQKLGVVSQDTFLLNATIAENIAFGTPGATKAQIEAACNSAQAAGFIENLTNGYNTLVGERGYRLSGGQRQRLSLARAILRNPELLILDEATSALDSESERLVQEAIERFERTHSVLVIAHRLSTIIRADQIIVLQAGRIIEIGDHRSLLDAKGMYWNMWIQQDLGSTRIPS